MIVEARAVRLCCFAAHQIGPCGQNSARRKMTPVLQKQPRPVCEIGEILQNEAKMFNVFKGRETVAEAFGSSATRSQTFGVSEDFHAS